MSTLRSRLARFKRRREDRKEIRRRLGSHKDWHYDWHIGPWPTRCERVAMDVAVERTAREIMEWADGEPVRIVSINGREIPRSWKKEETSGEEELG